MCNFNHALNTITNNSASTLSTYPHVSICTIQNPEFGTANATHEAESKIESLQEDVRQAEVSTMQATFTLCINTWCYCVYISVFPQFILLSYYLSIVHIGKLCRRICSKGDLNTDLFFQWVHNT